MTSTELVLTQGKTAIIDLEDLDRIINFSEHWFAHESRGTFYVECKKNGKQVKLHRFLTNCPPDKVVDHINRNGLDNRKCNLRVVSEQENRHNRGKYISNKSGVPGAHYCNSGRGRKHWIAQISRNGKQRLIGRYLTKEEAVDARKQAEISADGRAASHN